MILFSVFPKYFRQIQIFGAGYAALFYISRKADNVRTFCISGYSSGPVVILKYANLDYLFIRRHFS